MDILFEDINPQLVHCNMFNAYNLPSNIKFNTRTVYDYELEYYIKSDGGIEIDGDFVQFNKNEVNFRKPNQIVKGVGIYQCYTVCFDLKGNKNKSIQTHGFGRAELIQPLYDNLKCIPDKISGDAAKKLGVILADIHKYFLSNDFLLIKSELYKLINELLSISDNKDYLYNASVKKAIEYINNNYSEQINFDNLLKSIGISKPYFFSIFKKCTGVTPNRFITNLRISKAKYLLATTDMQISDIGFECGFSDSVYFSYVFRKEVGITATKFRIMNG